MMMLSSRSPNVATPIRPFRRLYGTEYGRPLLAILKRVQEKLERLIDKYMQQVGASKVSLSSISSQALWKTTNRLESYGPELFAVFDRKKTGYILAPTHEEEITKLVGQTCESYKDFPLRLYQIGRKYRDELRPRHGILRSREFLMKDLYTFDSTVESALHSYEEVRAVYSQLFDELKLPYLVAEASSGDIGGDLSHEYHLPSPIGEDIVMSCDSCSYMTNEELAEAKPRIPEDGLAQDWSRWTGISKDRSVQINVWYSVTGEPSDSDINTHAVKSIFPQLDTSISSQDATSQLGPGTSNDASNDGSVTQETKQEVINLIDQSIVGNFEEGKLSGKIPPTTIGITSGPDGNPLNLLRIRDGDKCTKCSSGTLRLQKAVELGHTFYLGTRYSAPLKAMIKHPDGKLSPAQMGCHGIGVSRIIGAVAEHLADDKGLNWPRAIAPYEVVILTPHKGLEPGVDMVYDELAKQQDPSTTQPLDMIIDDRQLSWAWKVNDADLFGFPIIVVVGRKWPSEQMCEVQCRRLGVAENVKFDELRLYINNLLSQL